MRDALPTRNAGLATALVVTPLLFIAAEIISPPLKSTSVQQLNVIAAHQSRWYWYTVLLVAGSITFIPAVLGVARVAGARSRRLYSAGLILTQFGAIVAACDAMTQLVTWQMAKQPNRAAMATLLDRYDNSSAANVFFALGGPALLVGTALLTTALIRGRSVPIWASVAFALGIIVNVVGFTANSVVVITAGDVLLLASGLRMARHLVAVPAASPAPAVPDAASHAKMPSR